MAQREVLLVGQFPGPVKPGRYGLTGWRPGTRTFRSVADIPAAVALLRQEEFALVLVAAGVYTRCGEVGEVLWACSTRPRTTPVVVIADRYDEREALLFFRMGVSEYLGLDVHQEKLAEIVSRLTGAGRRADVGKERPARLMKPAPSRAVSRAR